MGEGFSGNPAEIAGLGNYARGLSDGLAKICSFSAEAKAGDGFTGLMSELVEPVNRVETSFNKRWSTHKDHVFGISTELRNAAWMYSDTDERNRDRLLQHTSTVKLWDVMPPFVGVQFGPGAPKQYMKSVDHYPGAVSFGTPSAVDLKSPPQRDVDFNALIRFVSGFMADIDAKCMEFAHISQIRVVIEPLSGNWEELTRIGQVYHDAGAALDSIADDLEKGTRTIDPFWDGLAAQNFTQYSAHTVASLRWEASASRLIGQGLTQASVILNRSATRVLQSLKRQFETLYKVDEIRDALKVLTQKLPIAGLATTTFEIAGIVRTVIEDVEKMVAAVELVLNHLKDFLALVDDPKEYIEKAGREKIAEKTKPFTDSLESGKRDLQTSEDIATVIDVPRINNAPSERYSLGEGDSPWRDGK